MEMIAVGSIVQGNWSTIQYRADHVFQPKGKDYWCINGKDVYNKLSSGHFSYLGKRVGNEIMITDPRRPDDRLMVVKEKKRRPAQLEFAF
jgi:hypothetical protein